MTGKKDRTVSARKPAAVFQDIYFSASDGLKLYARDYARHVSGTQGRLPLVCLPGLTRNARDYHRLATIISGDPETPRRVVCFDYRGRGNSAWDKNAANYNIMTEAEDVLAGMAALGLEHAVLLGTSRGGLIMHALAAIRPTVMAAGILNDIGPVIEGAGLVQIKAYLSRTRLPATWEEAGPILKEAHSKSFPALVDADWDDMARAVYREKNGRLVADYDPALLQGLKDIDLATPLPTMWPQFDAMTHMPLMVLRGEHSSLLSEATVAEMRTHAPAMKDLAVEGHGHAPVLHLSGLPKAIGNFLRQVDAHRAT